MRGESGMDTPNEVGPGSGSSSLACSGDFAGVLIPTLSRFALAGLGLSRSWFVSSNDPNAGEFVDFEEPSPKLGHGGGHDLRAGRPPHCLRCGYLGDMPPQPLAIMCLSIEAGRLVSGT